MSLIFTGGDYAEGVPTILDVCARRQIPAHFFVTGDFIRMHAEAVRAIIAAKHTIGAHSDAHLLYCAWDDRKRSLVTQAQFEDDLNKNLDDLRSFGAEPSNFFVPPYEYYNDEHVKWASQMGLTLISFTPGSGSNRDYIPEGDRKFMSSDQIRKGILEFESTAEHRLNGFILLLHCGSLRQDKMHDQLDRLVADLVERGYQFVTLDELLPR